MRLRRPAVAAIAILSLLLPAPAYAVSASGTDPTGDTTVATSDITSLAVNFDHTTVTITITTAAALPALTDPSWNNRFVAVALEGGLDPNTVDLSLANGPRPQDVDNTAAGDGLPSENYGSFFLDNTGTFASSNSDHGDTAACDSANDNISGTTLTLTAPASCFGFPGSVEVEAVISNGTDAGSDVAISNNLDTATSVNAAVPGGYYLLGSDGGVFSFNQVFYGSTGSLHLNKPVVGMANLPSGGGYRFVASDGGVFDYGNANYYGSMGGQPLNQPIVGMASTPSGNGYWLVASDGGIFSYGDANFYGSMGGQHLNKPIVGMASTPSGHGYWLVASDGGIFAYGDANFFGSTGSIHLNRPIVGMAPTGNGLGYWLVASDGGLFAYGNAPFYGSGVNDFDNDVVGMIPSNGGYDLVGSQGDVFNYGPAYDYGDVYRNEIHLNGPIVGSAGASS